MACLKKVKNGKRDQIDLYIAALKSGEDFHAWQISKKFKLSSAGQAAGYLRQRTDVEWVPDGENANKGKGHWRKL